MKKTFLSAMIGLIVSTNAFADHGVERGLVKIEGASSLKTEIVEFLQKKLRACVLGNNNTDFFKLEKLNVREDRVDNGIIDYYYTLDFSYDATRNDQTSNAISVKVLDSKFDNWREYEEKLSFEIAYDRHKFCGIPPIH